MQAAEDLNAFVTATPDLARDKPGSPTPGARGGQGGVGHSVGIKFVLHQGILTSAGSRILTDFKPHRSTVTAG